MRSRVLVITAAVAMFTVSAFAQDTPRTVNGGIVNGRAISLPKPEYPEGARNAGISGTIGVNIILDENGNVSEARAEINDMGKRVDVDGTKLDPLPADPMLREAAENAAWKAKFAPTVLSGQPVRVKGMIVYNFVAGDKLAEAAQPPVATSAAMASSATLARQVSGGVLNGKATSLPSPAYPAAAKAVRAEGAVAVQIMIDETGTVISAAAVSGHPLLRAASEAAARAAKFSPTYLNGEAVKVSGVLTYNFVLPKIEQ